MLNKLCIKIKLDKIADVQNFIAKASKYDKLTIHADSYIVSASSLMGILSLDLDKPINLCWESPRMSEKIQKDFEQWAI